MIRLYRGALWAGLLLGFSAHLHSQVPAAGATPKSTTPTVLGKFDFTPVIDDQDFDGASAKVIVFKDGNVRWHLNLPTNWIPAGSAAELYLTNPKLPDARITLRTSALEAPPNYAGPWIDETKKLVLTALPRDSNRQQIANVTPNVLPIRGWSTIEFKGTYDRAGRRFSLGWLFIKLRDGRLLEVIYSGPDEKFTEIRATTFDMLSGWDLHTGKKVKH